MGQARDPFASLPVLLTDWRSEATPAAPPTSAAPADQFRKWKRNPSAVLDNWNLSYIGIFLLCLVWILKEQRRIAVRHGRLPRVNKAGLTGLRERQRDRESERERERE